MTRRKFAYAAFFVLTVFSAVIIYWPSRNFMALLPQGDRGRDFYVFLRVLRGDSLYHGLVWDYGPFSPYYYAFFMKIFGVLIPSVLWGEILLKIATGACVYACLALFFDLPLAFLGAIWFYAFNPNFIHTNNHLAGIFGIVLVLTCLLKYLKTQKRKWIYAASAALFIVFLVKYNIGLSTLAASVLSVFMIDIFSDRRSVKGTMFNLLPLALSLAAAASVYAVFLHGLFGYSLRLCFPILLETRRVSIPWFLSRAQMFFSYVVIYSYKNFSKSYQNLSLTNSGLFWAAGIAAAGTAGFIGYWLGEKKQTIAAKKETLLALAVLSLFCGFSLHEFALSPVNYRIIWATPLLSLLAFFAAGVVSERWPRLIKAPCFFFLGLTVCLAVQNGYSLKERTVKYAPFLYLGSKNARVYLNNPLGWVGTVEIGAKYLENTLKPGEAFLAVPYEPLYYYLLDRKSPVPEICFFESFPIPQEEEERMIGELEKEKVNYVLLSNREAVSGGFGIFREGHCPRLGAYLSAHFERTATFGDWRPTRDWIAGHAVAVYKRKVPIP